MYNVCLLMKLLVWFLDLYDFRDFNYKRVMFQQDTILVKRLDYNVFAVGEEYIEDVKSDVGKVIGYKCTLCDCRFNDVVARTAHVKGRRHRLNYKVIIVCHFSRVTL